jgi:hypothetical protein
MQISWLPPWKKTLAVPMASMLSTPAEFHFFHMGVKLDTHFDDRGIQ